eukprot:TRINITY_DN256_c0_g1_i4.p1 TRINITY_DN256_c0_g1~~TRINITY_DN256_c0_g1_i4.p1  ORF type:complete len:423 (+),score=93.39 TRINITY_DN256_c0_g1_i4:92-1360(+)
MKIIAILLLFTLFSLSQQQTTSLSATTATYLGNVLVGVGVGSDSILVAGSGQVRAAGFVAKLDRQGRSILGSVSIPGNPTIARSAIINGALSIAVGTDSGFSVVDSNLRVSSVSAVGTVNSISIGGDGTVATLSGLELRVYSSSGQQISAHNMSFNHIGNVEVDSQSKTVYVLGDYNRRYNGGPVRVVAIYAYDYELKSTKWTDYDFPGQEMGNDLGDTTGQDIRVGKDGSLYFLGGPMGGNNLFRHSPKSLTVPANNIGIDDYNDEFNLRSQITSYIGKLQPATGDLIVGQYLLARITGTIRGNSLFPKFVDADEVGNVFFLGDSACCIKDRDNITISGQAIAPYSGGEVTLYGVSSTFKTRLTWVAFTKKGNNGDPRGVSVSKGVGALVLNVEADQDVVTVNALHDTHSGASGYLVVWTY